LLQFTRKDSHGGKVVFNFLKKRSILSGGSSRLSRRIAPVLVPWQLPACPYQIMFVANVGPTEKNRAGPGKQVAGEILSSPAVPLKVSDGKKAAFVTPISAFASAARRSAAAMSGLRSRSCDGRPIGIGGGSALMVRI